MPKRPQAGLPTSRHRHRRPLPSPSRRWPIGRLSLPVSRHRVPTSACSVGPTPRVGPGWLARTKAEGPISSSTTSRPTVRMPTSRKRNRSAVDGSAELRRPELGWRRHDSPGRRPACLRCFSRSRHHLLSADHSAFSRCDQPEQQPRALDAAQGSARRLRRRRRRRQHRRRRTGTQSGGLDAAHRFERGRTQGLGPPGCRASNGGTLVLDFVNDRVGVGVSPTRPLDVLGRRPRATTAFAVRRRSTTSYTESTFSLPTKPTTGFAPTTTAVITRTTRTSWALPACTSRMA